MIIIPGVKKCGTTSLYKTLIQHSKIGKSKIKEPNFFAMNKELIEKNLENYKKIFEKDKIEIDASTTYYYNENAIKLIKKYIKKPKVLIIIRDPAKRTHSQIMFKKKIPSLEKRSLEKIIKEIKKNSIIKSEELSTRKALKNKEIRNTSLKEKKRLNDYKIRKITDSTVRELFNKGYKQLSSNPTDYFKNSLYSKYIKEWEKNFEIKIILFEELIKKPEQTIKNIQTFLNLPIEKITLTHANKTMIPKKGLNKLIKLIIKILPINIIKKLKPLKKYFYQQKRKITRQEYNQIRNILEKEYEYWSKKIPKTKEYWQY